MGFDDFRPDGDTGTNAAARSPLVGRKPALKHKCGHPSGDPEVEDVGGEITPRHDTVERLPPPDEDDRARRIRLEADKPDVGSATSGLEAQHNRNRWREVVNTSR